jgi:uncharacterized radical SAM superfamily protein
MHLILQWQEVYVVSILRSRSIFNTLIISCYRPRAAVVAKYGEKSVYFDLEDIGNTTGQWDLYGSDAPSPYNPLQVSIT